MVEQFAAYLGDCLIECGAAREQERPFLVYGLFCMVSGALQIVLLLAVSSLFHITIQVALYSFCFGILKRTIGGWHAQHHMTCLALFTSLAVGCVQIGQWVTIAWVLPLTLAAAVTMLAVVWQRAPVAHPNNPQTPSRLRELKRDSRVIAAAEFVLVVIPAILLAGTVFGRLFLDAALGSVTAALALLVPNKMPPES